MVGLEPEKLLNTNSRELIPLTGHQHTTTSFPELVPCRETLTHMTLTAPQSLCVDETGAELKLKGKSGVIDVLTCAGPAPLPGGEAGVVCVFATDIKMVEQIEALKLEISNLHALIDGLNAIVVTTNDKGNIDIWNQCAEEVTGHKKEEVKGLNFIDTAVSIDYKDKLAGGPAAVMDGCDGYKGVIDNNLVLAECRKEPNQVVSIVGTKLGMAPIRDIYGAIVGVSAVGHVRHPQTEDDPFPCLFQVDKSGTVDFWPHSTVQMTGKPNPDPDLDSNPSWTTGYGGVVDVVNPDDEDENLNPPILTEALGKPWIEVMNNQMEPESIDTMDTDMKIALGGTHPWKAFLTDLHDKMETPVPIICKVIPRKNGMDEITGARVMGTRASRVGEAGSELNKKAMKSVGHRLFVMVIVLLQKKLHGCLIAWQKNRERHMLHVKLSLEKLNQAMIVSNHVAMYSWLLNLRVRIVESEKQVINGAALSIALNSGSLDGLDIESRWQYKNPMNFDIFEDFDELTNHLIETDHNCGTLKMKITPSNRGLMITEHVKGAYLVLLHKRYMVDINTGVQYELRRCVPSISFHPIEVGIDGPGDFASEGDNPSGK